MSAPVCVLALSRQETLDRRQIHGALVQDKVVSFAPQRNKIQAKNPRRGTGRQAHIGLTRYHRIGSREVTLGDAIISADSARIDSGVGEQLVQKIAAAGPWLTVDEGDILLSEVLDLPNAFRISAPQDQAFFPGGERHHHHVACGELTANEGQIEFAGARVFEVRAGDVDLAFLEPG